MIITVLRFIESFELIDFRDMETLFSIEELLIVIGLIYSYFSLSSLIYKHHPKRFAEIKTQMSFFFYVETIPFTFEIFYNLVLFLRHFYTDFPSVVSFRCILTLNLVLILVYPLL